MAHITDADKPDPNRLILGVLTVGLIAASFGYIPSERLASARYLYPKELALAVTAFIASITVVLRSRKLNSDIIDYLLLAFIITGLASAAIAVNLWIAIRAIGISLSGALIFWIVRHQSTELRSRVLLLVAGMVAVIAVGAVLEAYGVLPNLSEPSRAPGGPVGHRNRMAHVLVLGLPVLWLVASRSRSRTSLIIWCVGIVVVSMALALSRCRAAWLATAVLAVAALSIVAAQNISAAGGSRGRVAVLAFSSLIGLALAVAIPNELRWTSANPYNETIRTLLQYESGSGRGRVIQYLNTLDLIREYPLLGVGPGNWGIHYPRFSFLGDPSLSIVGLAPAPARPQGDWIAIAAERGIPALLLLFAVGSIIMHRGLRSVRSAGQLPGEGLAAICTVIGLAVIGTFDGALVHALPTFLIALSLGALTRPAGGSPILSLSRRKRGAIAIGLAGMGLLITAQNLLQTSASLLYGRRTNVESLTLAVRLAPYDYFARALLARYWVRAGECALAAPHIAEARRLYPTAEVPVRLHAECGGPRSATPEGFRRVGLKESLR